ncbi:MAG: membrane protein insertion efficiency factor YidD [Myxococcota bacterium]|nr:membrane protein insertion efficiency factor YidD [Myxococcota bacterium]
MMTSALIVLVRVYQRLISPFIGGNCRFTPTCSAYAIQALERHGALRATPLVLWRLLRCGPWGGCGEDPVPDQPGVFVSRRQQNGD